MVDELGALEAELAPFKSKLARIETLRSAIRGVFVNSPPGECFLLAGFEYNATVGICGNETVIDNQALYKLAGPKLFVEMARVSQKTIKESCGETTLAAVTTILACGSRSLVVSAIPLCQPASPAIAQSRIGGR